MIEKLGRNVWVLFSCQLLAFSASFSVVFAGSLIGAALAPSESLATAPMAMMVIGTAAAIAPLANLMKRHGRRRIFRSGALWGAFACLVLAGSVHNQWFIGFCLGTFFLGNAIASVQLYRFAAMESVAVEHQALAASVILLSGIGAALIGPEVMIGAKGLFSVDYTGSFLVFAALFALVAALLGGYRNIASGERDASGEGRPLAVLIRQPVLWLALAAAGLGFAVMSLVMTATPISMHLHHGYSLTDTKWVIQSHILAMFLPSLFAPLLVRWINIKGLMVVGVTAYGCSAVLALSNSSLAGFWVSLILLGVGWNFLFLAGTTLLPLSYRQGEQFKVQGFNDGVVFSMQALASLSAGWLMSVAGWNTMLFGVFPMLLVLCLMIALVSIPGK